jgi:hypothetical protein
VKAFRWALVAGSGSSSGWPVAASRPCATSSPTRSTGWVTFVPTVTLMSAV